MQDRYAGDLGDYLKLGLLHELTRPDADGQALSLGVVWYLARDENHNADGKHVSYLDSGSRSGRVLRPLNPRLYDQLAEVVATDRSVRTLERVGVLPAGTLTFADELSFEDVTPPSPSARGRHRADWVQRASEAVAGADLVFVDPDNGLRRSTHPIPRHRSASVKHAYYDELRAFTEQGQSIVAYHHADRSAKVEIQAQRRLDEAGEELDLEPLVVVRASRGTTRLFVICAQAPHRDRLDSRIRHIEQGAWSGELRIIRPSADTGSTDGDQRETSPLPSLRAEDAMTALVSEVGDVRIPVELRRQLAMSAGTLVRFKQIGDAIVMTRARTN